MYNTYIIPLHSVNNNLAYQISHRETTQQNSTRDQYFTNRDNDIYYDKYVETNNSQKRQQRVINSNYNNKNKNCNRRKMS